MAETDNNATATIPPPTVDWQNDPDFHQLPLPEKHKALLAIDPGYKALPPAEQAKALNTIHYGAGGAGTGEQFIKENKVPGRIEAGNEEAGKILGSTGLLPTSISDIPHWGRVMTGQEPGEKPWWEPIKEAVAHPTERSVVGAVPVIGPMAVQAADEPTLLGKAGVVAGGALGGVGAGEVKPGLSALAREATQAREGIGAAIHDPATGEMTKVTKGLSGGTGAAVGGATGAGIGSLFGPRGVYAGAGIGATAGGVAGPALMEKMFPEPASRIGARETFAKTKALTEAQEGATAENAAREKAARVESDRIQRVADKATADAEAARAKLESDSMARMKMTQSLEDATKKAQKELAAHRAAMEKADMDRMNFANTLEKQTGKEAQTARAKMESDSIARAKMTKSLEDAVEKAKQNELDNIKQSHAEHAKQVKELEDARQAELAANEKLKEQHAAALNKRGDVKKMTPPTETGGTPQGKPTPFTNPQDLITRTKKLVIPGEKPTAEDLKRAGDMTQFQLPKLKALAAHGDELAKNEINRRSRNEPDFSKMALPRGNAPAPETVKPLTPVTPPRVPIEQKVKTLVPPERRGMEGPPMNQLKVLSDKLERTDLTDFERNTLEAQFEDLTGRKWTPRAVKK
jgi:hypothetical protein